MFSQDVLGKIIINTALSVSYPHFSCFALLRDLALLGVTVSRVSSLPIRLHTLKFPELASTAPPPGDQTLKM